MVKFDCPLDQIWDRLRHAWAGLWGNIREWWDEVRKPFPALSIFLLSPSCQSPQHLLSAALWMSEGRNSQVAIMAGLGTRGLSRGRLGMTTEVETDAVWFVGNARTLLWLWSGQLLERFEQMSNMVEYIFEGWFLATLSRIHHREQSGDRLIISL